MSKSPSRGLDDLEPLRGPWFNLSHPWGEVGRSSYPHTPFSLEVDKWVSPMGLNLPISISRFSCGAHVATHVDAPRHFDEAGSTIDTFFEYGVHIECDVVDLSYCAAAPITADVLQRAGVSPPVGGGLIVNFGYSSLYENPVYLDHPHLDASAGEWLAERELVVLGVDTLSPDLPQPRRSPDFDWPVHRSLLSAGCAIVENVGGQLDAVTGWRIELLLHPMRIVGADGAPVVPLARRIVRLDSTAQQR